MRKILVILAIVAIAAAALVLVLRREPTPGGDVASSAPQALEQAGGSREAAAAPPETATTRSPVVPSSPLAPTHARILGRCVAAENDAPLSGCGFLLTFLARGGVRAGQEPLRVADAEGRFRIDAAIVPQGEHCVLSIGDDGRASLAFDLGTVAQGQVIDLGAVRLARGVLVTGMVRDTNGEPWPDCPLTITRLSAPGDVVPHTMTSVGAKCGADGRFAFGQRVTPGTWKMSAQALLSDPMNPLKAELTVEIAADETTRHVEIVVPAPEAVITGIATDLAGAAAVGVTILCNPCVQQTSTDAHGRFRLVRPKGANAAPVRISVPHGDREFERYEVKAPVPWDTHDVHLPLERLQTVEVQVLDADGGPVEAFRLQCFPHPSRNSFFSSQDREPRMVERARDGMVVAKGVRKGPNVVKVVPLDLARHPLGTFVEFEMTERGAPRQVLRLPPAALRTAIVTTGDGAPVEGARIELVEAIGARCSLPGEFDDLAALFVSGNSKTDGLCWCRVVTGPGGDAQLLGPGGKSFALQVRGARVLTRVVEGVSLDVAEPLRIEIARGAELRGTIGPADVLATLRTPPPLARLVGALPRLVLEDPGHRGRVHPPPDDNQPPMASNLPGVNIAEDRSFSIVGIPPGTWRLVLLHAPRDGQPGATQREVLMERVADLKDGEVRELRLDLSGLTSTRLEGVIVHGNVPCAGALVSLSGAMPDAPGQVLHRVTTSCDAKGRFAIAVPPGLYSLAIRPARSGPFLLPCTPSVVAERGRTVAAGFTVRMLRATVRLVDGNGTPVANREGHMGYENQGSGFRTDQEGRFTIDPAPAHPIHVLVWPAHMNDATSRELLRRDGKGKLPENQIQSVGQITPPLDRDEVEVVLTVLR